MQWDGDAYQQRFDDLAASGVAIHGEADFVERYRPRSVLDAGCGTGRVGGELARRGIDVTGVDADPSMIATARRSAPSCTWLIGDVATIVLDRTFDLVVMAGNVPLFTPPGTQAALVAGCRRHLVTEGRLVAGFSLDRHYSLESYDEHCQAAGLELEGRRATWSGQPYAGGAYAVSCHLLGAARPRVPAPSPTRSGGRPRPPRTAPR